MPSTQCARLCIAEFLLCFRPSRASLALCLWAPHCPPFSAWRVLSTYFSAIGLLQRVVYLVEVSPLLFTWVTPTHLSGFASTLTLGEAFSEAPLTVLLCHAVRAFVFFLIAFFAPFNNRFYLYSIYSTIQ